MLEKIQLMLNAVESALTFLQITSERMMKNLSENAELSELKFLDDCFNRMQSGADFPTAWRGSLEEKENIRNLKNADVVVLISFGEMFGTTDTAGQISNCRVHSELIKDRLSVARSERERYSSLFCGMGIVCGIGLIIMMI